ncbi:rCG27647, isoform CRA_a [Rattus norvegicus]|uniref:RCG27647, isoform CRA_a n=1 Tax=Rattus norvegicus TaxID=10116 RepID=A6KBS8_RAT|nr:rCG27647, isoform CRA_a [Rattus norvegicus]
MRRVGLAARRPRLCDAAVKPTFPLSRSCRTRGPWRLCGPEAKLFAGCSAGPSPAAAFGWPVSALRSAGMLRPAGPKSNAGCRGDG